MGTLEKDGVRGLAQNTDELLFKGTPFKQKDFDIVSPLNILSENLKIEHWQILLDFFKTIDFNNYSGVIITHGTDTLAFTAAFVAHITKGLSMPVVLIANNHPLPDPRANGRQNFIDAVNLILTKKHTGTFVCYGGKVFTGRRIQSWRPFENSYTNFSPVRPFQNVNIAEQGVDAFNDAYADFPFELKRFAGEGLLEDNTKPLYKSLTTIKNHVLILYPYPGIDYERLQIENVDAIIHMTYHSLTYNNDVSILKERCKAKGIPLIVGPTRHGIIATYTSKVDGLIEVPNTSLETLFAMAVVGEFD